MKMGMGMGKWTQDVHRGIESGNFDSSRGQQAKAPIKAKQSKAKRVAYKKIENFHDTKP